MTDLIGPAAEQLADAIVTKRESLHFETKRLADKKVGRALDTVCALANTEGGILALGLEDFDKARGRDRIYGIEENPEAIGLGVQEFANRATRRKSARAKKRGTV